MKAPYIFASILLTSLPMISLAGGAQTSTKFPASGANYSKFSLDTPPLLPMPQEIHWTKKVQYLSSANIVIDRKSSDPKQMNFVAKELANYLKEHEVGISQEAPFKIQFVTGSVKVPAEITGKRADEAYQLEVTANGAKITAPTTKGFYYAMNTLEQLLVRKGGKTSVALCKIVDWPDFEVRGFMNDVGRNFMSIPLIHEELEAMSRLKFNVYHFHFTENEGWRLESKIFPELTEAKNHTRQPGKFYTQKEFQDLVEYCRLRNIQLIPEMDMPGHCGGFRRALNIEKMSDPKATEALTKLVDEMCALVPKDQMPYVHIGTDEARGGHERVNDEILKQYYATVEKNDRIPIRWQPGLAPKGYNGAVQQLWSGRQARHAWPTPNSKYIDSLETYLNHLDPFETAMTMYFRRPCPFENAEGLGMILCSWPDLPIENERNQVLHTPVYPGMAFVSESLWNNPHEQIKGNPNNDEYMKYFSNLPVQGDPLLDKFAKYEDRVLAIRDRFFINKEFNYVRQANMPWKLIGPFPNKGNVDMEFPPEAIAKGEKVAKSYEFDGKQYEWSPETHTGNTILFKHYCDFPTLFNGNKMGAYPYKDHTYYAMTYIYSPKKQDVPFWVSGHTWATSDWRNGPVSVQGKWFHTNPKFFVNGKEIAPPEWQKPGNNGALVDENYHFRKPTVIALNKGWNQVLVKSPSNGSARRWMFTFAPVLVNEKTPGQNVKEFPGLKFSVTPGK